MTLHDALRALNDAAYAAIRAGTDTTAHPDLDRQALREIAAMTDKLVDDNAPTGRFYRVPGCKTCSGPFQLIPPHDPSPNCESGKRPHCTCDTCF